MAEDILSQFLIRIAYQQDDKSRKDFDEGLKQVQTRAAEFGEKIAALPTIVSEATKRISSSLTAMYYSAQKNGATARELDALRYAAEQSGEGADNASASFNAFSQRIRDFATGAARQYKTLFGVDVDPNHTLDAFIHVREKIEELRNRGGADNLSRANLYARTFGIDEEALIPGRLAEFKKRFDEQLKRNSDIAAEKAVALTRAYNALAAALETVARKADSTLFDKFGAVLDRLTKWLDEDSERIVKFFTDLVTQVGLVFTDLGVLKPAFVLLWDALQEVGGWLQKIIGQPDSTGLAGVRHLLEFISGAVMARFVASMVAGFIAAFAPLTALLTALASLGMIGVGAYMAGAAVRGWLGGGEAGSGGFGAGEGTESGGHGAQRRGKFGHGGAVREGKSAISGVPYAAGEATSGLQTDQAHYDAFRNSVAQIESGGQYNIMGGAGGHFAGRYQLGAIGHPELADTAKSLGVPTPTIADFLAAPAMQERFFERYTLNHHKWLMAHSPEYRALSVDDKLAALGYAHNQGAGGLAQYLRTHKTGHDAFGTGGDVYEKAIRKAIAKLHDAKQQQQRAVGQSDPHKPGFDWLSIPFHNYHPEMLQGQPLGTDQHSMNEIHDHRSVVNDVNIHVAGTSTKDLTVRPLGRPRNADLIRNTASYAA